MAAFSRDTRYRRESGYCQRLKASPVPEGSPCHSQARESRIVLKFYDCAFRFCARRDGKYTRLQSLEGYIADGMLVTTEIGTRQLAELVNEVQAGNEVLLTQGNKPVARLVPANSSDPELPVPLRTRTLTGHRVLIPVASQEELAEDMFGR